VEFSPVSGLDNQPEAERQVRLPISIGDLAEPRFNSGLQVVFEF
jgi:hypothetical protein